jgi:hypothetical protein
MTTPLPPHSGTLPGGRGVKPTVTATIGSDSRPARIVGMGAKGVDVSPPEPSGRRIQTKTPLPAQGKVAQGRAPSSLDRHGIIPGVVADRPMPVQTPQPGKNSKDAGFYG